MSHKDLIVVLRYCPYSVYFYYPKRLLSRRTHNVRKALGEVESMITHNMINEADLDAISEKSNDFSEAFNSHRAKESHREEEQKEI